jgi:hypothetical protein
LFSRKIGKGIEMVCIAFPVNGTGSASLTPDAVYLPGVCHTYHRYKRYYLFFASRFAISIVGSLFPTDRDKLFRSKMPKYNFTPLITLD